MTEIEARVADLINFSSNQKPIEFADAFKNILQVKVGNAIEAKKAEIAQTMFVSRDQEAEDELEDLEDDVEVEAEEESDTEDQEDA